MSPETFVVTAFGYATAAYLVLATVKFILLLGSFPAALGTYHRIAQRSGANVSRMELGGMLLLVNLYICLVGVLQALYREKFRFFIAYRNFGVMRDVLRNFKGAVA